MQMTEKKIIEQVPYPENLTRIILDKHDDKDLITSEDCGHVLMAVEKACLEERQQLLIKLRYKGQMQYGEISELMNVSRPKIGVLNGKVLQRIRTAYILLERKGFAAISEGKGNFYLDKECRHKLPKSSSEIAKRKDEEKAALMRREENLKQDQKLIHDYCMLATQYLSTAYDISMSINAGRKEAEYERQLNIQFKTALEHLKRAAGMQNDHIYMNKDCTSIKTD